MPLSLIAFTATSRPTVATWSRQDRRRWDAVARAGFHRFDEIPLLAHGGEIDRKTFGSHYYSAFELKLMAFQSGSTALPRPLACAIERSDTVPA